MPDLLWKKWVDILTKNPLFRTKIVHPHGASNSDAFSLSRLAANPCIIKKLQSSQLTSIINQKRTQRRPCTQINQTQRFQLGRNWGKRFENVARGNHGLHQHFILLFDFLFSRCFFDITGFHNYIVITMTGFWTIIFSYLLQLHSKDVIFFLGTIFPFSHWSV